MSTVTPIQNFYKNKTIFLTGFTGFLGHVIFEKILRSCPDIKRMYILVRPRKGLNAKQRLDKLLNNEFFNSLKEERPNFSNYVSIMDGDLFEDNLGLSEKDINIFLNEVNIVIHSAATVKFDEKLKIAGKLNICSTKNILQLTQKCSNFQSFVHISTAYSNCYQQDVDEQFYTPKVDPWELIEKINNTDENALELMKQELIGEHPNTYTFTKNLAEHVVKIQGKGLPVCVVRPSIIMAANEEPHKGWTGSNITGPFGIMAGCGAGFIRVLNIDTHAIADFIPVDMVANAIIAAAFHTAQKSQHNEVTVYNIVSGKTNPITWGEHTTLSMQFEKPCAPSKSLWTPALFSAKCAYWNKILQFVLHIIPGYLLDFLFIILRKKPIFVDTYKKIHAACAVSSFFLTGNWNFNDANTRELFMSLNKNDQKIFNFDVTKIDWTVYYLYFIRGIRQYVLRDPLSTIPQGIKQSRWRSLINITLFVLLVHFTFSTASIIILGSVLTYTIMCSY